MTNPLPVLFLTILVACSAATIDQDIHATSQIASSTKSTLLEKLKLASTYKSLPDWLQEGIVSHKYLDTKNLTVEAILDKWVNNLQENIDQKLGELKEEMLKKKDFLVVEYNEEIILEKFEEVKAKSQIEKAYPNVSDPYLSPFRIHINIIWGNKAVKREVQSLQKKNISDIVEYVIQKYTWDDYRDLNKNLRERDIIKLKDQIYWLVLLQHALKKHNEFYVGRIYRGTLCDTEMLKSQIGKQIAIEQMTSFSSNEKIAKEFISLSKTSNPAEKLRSCLIKLDLSKNSECGVDIKKYSGIPDQDEILVPFNTKLNVIDVRSNNASDPHSYYDVSWSC